MLRLAHFPLHHVQYMFFVSTILRSRCQYAMSLADFTVLRVYIAHTHTQSPKTHFIHSDLSIDHIVFNNLANLHIFRV